MRLIAWTGGLVFVASLAWFVYFYAVVLGRLPEGAGPLLPPLAVNLLLFAAFGVHHSLFAREGVKHLLARWVPPALERSLFVWAASGLFALICLAWQPMPGGELYRLGGWTGWLGRAAQLLGLALTVRTAALLDVLELAGIRMAQGETRPSPMKVVGPYRWVRHPLYLGWLLFVFGVPLMTADRLTFAVTSAVYLAIGIPFEERSLVASLGEPYRDYLRAVRWRVVPFLY